LDWDGIVEHFAWVQAMKGCGQDPQWQAEGDVLIHTRMVCEALSELNEWRSLGEVDRSVVFAATLMHDVAKPIVTREEDGRLRAPRHASKGAQLARRLLMQELLPTESLERLHLREQIVNLIRHHGLPLYLFDRFDPQRELLAASQVVRCDWLATLALADVLGRRCSDKDELRDRVEMFREFAVENKCSDAPRYFASDHTRFLYFHGRDLDPDYEVYDDTTVEVIVISGLPGSGKDHWIQRHGAGWPVVSLDAIRCDLNISPEDTQGIVVNRAKELAREYLRKRTRFIWNATNTTLQMRRQLIQLFRDYNARVQVVYVESSWNETKRRNLNRENPVPQNVLDKLVGKLDVPDLTETHALQFHYGET
jgi:putative nucleotidyltransferase with HDIG domain